MWCIVWEHDFPFYVYIVKIYLYTKDSQKILQIKKIYERRTVLAISVYATRIVSIPGLLSEQQLFVRQRVCMWSLTNFTMLNSFEKELDF